LIFGIIRNDLGVAASDRPNHHCLAI